MKDDEVCAFCAQPNTCIEAGRCARNTCGNCNGTGRMVRDPDIGTDQECFACDGSGYSNDKDPE
jgi:DnaJ-class molecular chaperone